MNTALIISGGEYSPVELTIKYDYVVACDKGYEYARKMGIIPDLLIGDFDSLHTKELEMIPKDVDVFRYPVEKDDTDTMLGVKNALSKGCRRIDILCALGGRLDHLMANIQVLKYISEQGAIGAILSEKERLNVFNAPFEIKIPYEENKSLSIYALSDDCEKVSIKGTKYEVEKISLSNSFPLGYGNEIINDYAKISAKAGSILIIQSVIQ